MKKSRDGTRIICIPGNHDDDLRALVGMHFGNIEVARRHVHTTHTGRRLLVLHGDEFDAVIKCKLTKAQRYIDKLQRASLHAATETGVDGVVCGHIHKADIVERGGLVYCSDGDWVESCTAIVEHLQGELELIAWRPASAIATLPVAVRDAA